MNAECYSLPLIQQVTQAKWFFFLFSKICIQIPATFCIYKNKLYFFTALIKNNLFLSPNEVLI